VGMKRTRSKGQDVSYYYSLLENWATYEISTGGVANDSVVENKGSAMRTPNHLRHYTK
jgi:hypothetical protein